MQAGVTIPVLVEIDDSFTTDPADLEDKITSRSSLILPVHMCGVPSNMPAIMEIARHHGIRVLEDCAQANGATLHGKAVGTFGEVARTILENSGVLSQVSLFLSPADTPSVEQLMAPRAALTLAEFLAFDQDMHVLVLLTNMTNYCDALREIASARGEIPTRKGYPGYLYSELASLYERAGRIKEADGSITLMPILTMPSDDISHPVPDLTGYITEGQIVCKRELDQKGIYPPVAGLPSLSRLMKDGVGDGVTREDHQDIASQLFAAYAQAEDVRDLAAVIGEEELSPQDQTYLELAEAFEQQFVSQGESENRSIEQTLDLAWRVAGFLPRSELSQISDQMIERYYQRRAPEEEERGGRSKKQSESLSEQQQTQ